MVQGTAEALFGGGAEGAGLLLDLTGIGALAGIPLNVVGAGLIAQGAATAAGGAGQLIMQASGLGPTPSGDGGSAPANSGEPGQWQGVNESMSPSSDAYQTQITGHSGEAYVVNGVKFDGYDPATGLQEAKGPGYANFVDENGDFKSWFENSGARSLLDQARRQLTAAPNTPITWYVAEPKAADAIQTLFQDNNVPIQVVTAPFKP